MLGYRLLIFCKLTMNCQSVEYRYVLNQSWVLCWRILCSTIVLTWPFNYLPCLRPASYDYTGGGGTLMSGTIKVCHPKTNNFLKPTLCTTCIHLETPNASKCMHVVHSVGFRILLVLGRHTLVLSYNDPITISVYTLYYVPYLRY